MDDALCAWTVKCAGGTSDDEAACRAATAERRARAAYSLGEAIASGRAELDSARLDACVASIRGADCAELPREQCFLVVRGKVPPGGACKDDAECAGGTCAHSSEFATPGCDGVCKADPKRGDPCTDRCSPEDYCDTTTHVCVADKPLGAMCKLGECDIGVSCSGPAGDTVCGAPRQEGDACVPVATVERQCALGLYCAGQLQPLSGTCTRRVGEGQSCTTSPQCEDGLLCVAAADGTATCARPLAEGAACVSTPSVGEPGCQLDRPCDASGHCRRLPALDGRPCADGADCASAFEMGTYYCDAATKVCVRTASVGEPCVLQQPPMASCLDGVCDAATHRCVLFCG